MSGARPTIRPALLRAGVAAATLFSAAAFATPPTSFADAVTRPATASVRVGSALYLAVSRAGNRLVAVGERGFVLLSDDDGHSWRQALEVPTSVTLTRVQFVTAQLGWAVGHGGVVLHSRDGGERWVRQLEGREAAARLLEEARALAAAAADQGEAEVKAAANAVRDAERFVGEGPDKPLLGLYFADASRGWVVGAYGLALATDDGGRSWRSITHRLDNPAGKHLNDIGSDSRGALVIAGEQGALFRSDAPVSRADAGVAPAEVSFVAVKTPYTGSYFGTVESRGGELVAYGLRGNAYRLVESGTRWQKVELGQAATVTAGARLADGAVVLADETGRVMLSHDGAANFAALASGGSRSFTAIAQALDGALVLAGAGGMTRLAPDILTAEDKK